MDSLYLFIIALLLIPLAVAGRSLAPWVPTRTKDLPRINEQLRLKPGAVFYELGCGDGRVCRYIAKHNPEVTVIGIELTLYFYLIARLIQRIHPLPNLSYVHGNALKQSLKNADAIYAYALVKTVNTKLKPKLLQELKPGARFVSYSFAISDWPGTAHTTPDGLLHTYIK